MQVNGERSTLVAGPTAYLPNRVEHRMDLNGNSERQAIFDLSRWCRIAIGAVGVVRGVLPTLTLLAVLFMSPLASAKEFLFHGIGIVVPRGFEGPNWAPPDPKADTAAFSVPGTPGVPTTVLQMTRYRLNTAPALSSEEQLARLAAEYMSQLLEELHPDRITPSSVMILGSLLVAKKSWIKSFSNYELNGIMFSTIKGSDVIIFQVMGPGKVPNKDMNVALSALANVSFGRM